MPMTIANRLRAFLDRDAQEEGGIVASRGGLINRAHYARLLGVSTSLLHNFYKEILTAYEKEYQIATGPLAKLDEMRAWLEQAYNSGELGIRDGRVDRLACMEHFGIKGGNAITRFPEIRELFESFDRRVVAENYLPNVRRVELDKVKAWLLRPVLNKDRLTINRQALTAAVEIELIRLADRQFAEAIASCEAEILEKAKKSLIDPYFHGRVFPFSELENLWSREFLGRVGARYKMAFSGSTATSAKHPYLIIFGALEWIGQSNNPNCRAVVADAKANGKILNNNAWEEAIYQFRDYLIAQPEQTASAKTGVDSQIKSLRAALDALASGQVTPKLSTSLAGIKLAGRRGGQHLKSVAEAQPASLNSAVDPYVQFARNQFEIACRSTGSDSDKAELEGFIASIEYELTQQTNLPSDPSGAVLAILEKRLAALGDKAATLVKAARLKFDQGRHLLSLADIDSLEFENSYVGSELNRHEKIQLLRKFFPYPVDSSDAARDRTIANLLKLFCDRFNGAPPAANKPLPEYGQFFQKRYLELGGLSNLESFLLPNAEACGAVLTLYLCEGGANVSVGRTIDRNCVQTSDQAGYALITGHKARAAGKPIFVDLPAENVAVQALQWLKMATDSLAPLAGDDSDRLFLMRIGGRIQLMTPHWYTSWFKSFAASTPNLDGLNLVPSMLRPSVLLSAALANDGRLQVGRAIGQHGLQVTQGYQQKWPTRLLYDQQIRRFQNDLEALIVQSIPDAAHRLGLTEAEMQARLDKVFPTGLGTFCLNLVSAGQKDQRCKTMSCWDDCPHLLIVAEVEAIAALQLWQESLRAAAPEWERDRPERWEKIWLPWLCLVDVVEEKMTRGLLIKIWRAASQRMTELKNSSNFVPHRPF